MNLTPLFRIVPILFSVTSSVCADPLWRVEGLSQPESAVFDEERDRIIVSNINGHPAEVDGNGYLSLVSVSGEILDLHWIEGLDAPKGMALVGTQLFVADIKRLVSIDVETGQIENMVYVEEAVFLNDVAVGNQGIWVTDLLGNSIYQYADGEMNLWLQTDKLAHPNGLVQHGETLVVASWGAGLKGDFSTEFPGGLLSVDLQDKSIDEIKGAGQLGNLDGVFEYASILFTNDWFTGEVFAIDTENKTVVSKVFYPGLADISLAGNLVLMPYMHDGALEARTLNMLY